LKIFGTLLNETSKEKMPQNQKDLTDFMKEEWDAIPESILINLIKSMRRRCELVIENNGERTPY